MHVCISKTELQLGNFPTTHFQTTNFPASKKNSLQINKEIPRKFTYVCSLVVSFIIILPCFNWVGNTLYLMNTLPNALIKVCTHSISLPFFL